MSALQLGLFSPRWSTPIVLTTSSHRAYVDPFAAANADRLAAAGDLPLSFDEATWDHAARGAVGLDVEVYRNFFAACLKRFADGKRLTFERSRRTDFDADVLLRILHENVVVTFNGNAYDLPILALALAGADPTKLKQASDLVIRGNARSWDVERELGVRAPRFNHIDLIEPNPSVRQGLKMIHGRLHGRFLVDLPHDPEAILTPRGMNEVTLYCHNDLDATELLYRALREPLEMRVALGRRYAVDLRSRSDSQVGETIVKRRIERAVGRRLDRVAASTTESFRYEPPGFVSFVDQRLNTVLKELAAIDFQVNSYGKIETPELLKDLRIGLGDGTYAMGIGGLHSTEAHRALRTDADRSLIDVDVASQYPSIIRNLGLYPKALGPTFLTVYADMIKERLAAKQRQLEIDREIIDLERQLKEIGI